MGQAKGGEEEIVPCAVASCNLDKWGWERKKHLKTPADSIKSNVETGDEVCYLHPCWGGIRDREENPNGDFFSVCCFATRLPLSHLASCSSLLRKSCALFACLDRKFRVVLVH